MEKPSMLGSKWTSEEECQLLEELNKNIEMKKIAQIYNRTFEKKKDIVYKKQESAKKNGFIIKKVKKH